VDAVKAAAIMDLAGYNNSVTPLGITLKALSHTQINLSTFSVFQVLVILLYRELSKRLYRPFRLWPYVCIEWLLFAISCFASISRLNSRVDDSRPGYFIYCLNCIILASRFEAIQRFPLHSNHRCIGMI